jgi:hypothetical protein
MRPVPINPIDVFMADVSAAVEGHCAAKKVIADNRVVAEALDHAARFENGAEEMSNKFMGALSH